LQKIIVIRVPKFNSTSMDGWSCEKLREMEWSWSGVEKYAYGGEMEEDF
jgi:hypothetical protein